MGPKKKILVLDDDGCIRDLLDEVLQEAGYDVITTERPSMAAVRAYKADLIILDLSMSGAGGTEGLDVLIHLWEDKLNNTPVLIFSAYAYLEEVKTEITELEEIYGEGRKISGYVYKSDGMIKLVESVNNVFRGTRKQVY